MLWKALLCILLSYVPALHTYCHFVPTPDYLRGYWPGLFGASLISRPPVTIIFCAPGRSAEYCQKHLVPSTFQEAAGAPGLV